MRSMLSTLFPLTLAGSTLGATYNIAKSTEGNAFFTDFNVIAEADPTHGLVNYVNLATAQSQGLLRVVNGNFQLRPDSTTVLTNGAGRNSVRMESAAQYDNHVVVFNVNHMPAACGTWPALWEYGPNWPANGEVDIVEGVNGVGPNSMTLHTSPGCSIPASGLAMTGTVKPGDTNCDTSVNGNSGCSVASGFSNAYGAAFNANGGGWYAMERTPSFIKVWFWPRGASNLPSDVNSGANTINTSNWGEPDALFPNTNCNIDSHFGPNNIVINLTFCGDWAGQASVYASSGCPSTCNDFVSNNPSAFANAYFEIPWVKVYQ
ncbi:endo-beta-glucanase [Vararia minispora EC-137]|uniref:Endo-beta-glucanase n=1 Tax=Vararia minispora EC-137 TaxID=1314806 RepID=A0ACB8QX78_9AGAM|nr:endo-beta-glucanase [Vararia minispora EC-137]